jgi:hypothetical protein
MIEEVKQSDVEMIDTSSNPKHEAIEVAETVRNDKENLQ